MNHSANYFKARKQQLTSLSNIKEISQSVVVRSGVAQNPSLLLVLVGVHVEGEVVDWCDSPEGKVVASLLAQSQIGVDDEQRLLLHCHGGVVKPDDKVILGFHESVDGSGLQLKEIKEDSLSFGCNSFSRL